MSVDRYGLGLAGSFSFYDQRGGGVENSLPHRPG